MVDILNRHHFRWWPDPFFSVVFGYFSILHQSALDLAILPRRISWNSMLTILRKCRQALSGRSKYWTTIYSLIKHRCAFWIGFSCIHIRQGANRRDQSLIGGKSIFPPGGEHCVCVCACAVSAQNGNPITKNMVTIPRCGKRGLFVVVLSTVPVQELIMLLKGKPRMRNYPGTVKVFIFLIQASRLMW